MPRIALVTDSTANLTAEWTREHDLDVVPVYIHFGNETSRDGVDMDTATFYRRLETSPSLPKTSQPSVGDFLDVYRRLAGEGSAIVSIHLARELSGTIASAEAARSSLLAEWPDAPPIHVVDCRGVSAAMALVVSAARRAIDAGRTADAVAQIARTLGSRTTILFTVDTLTYLQKGGRIGGAAALVGSLLQVRPVLNIQEGRVDVVERVRTTKRARQRLLEIVSERVGTRPMRVAVAHAAVPEEAEATRRCLSERFDCRELFVVEFSPVVGAHCGPGTLGVAFYPADEPPADA